MKRKIFIILLVLFGLAFSLSVPSWSEDGFYVIPTGPRGTILKYQLFSSNTVDTLVPTGDHWHKLVFSPMWNYNKLSATSTLFVTYQDTLSGSGMDVPLSYQVRMNDLSSDAGEGGATITINVPSRTTSLSATGVWSALPRGDITISIWQRTTVNGGVFSCSRNISPYTTTIIVMEVER